MENFQRQGGNFLGEESNFSGSGRGTENCDKK